MKFNYLAVTLSVLVFGIPFFHPHRSVRQPNVQVQQNPVRTVRLHLEGLKTRNADRARVAIVEVPGVLDVQMHPDQRLATVKFDVQRTNIRKLERNVQAAGFSPWF